MSEYTPNMEDLIEAFAFDESEGRGVKYGELTTGPASRRFREAKELAEQAVAAELRRAKAEALGEYADTLGVDTDPYNDGDWWAGYRQAQREFVSNTVRRAEQIEQEDDDVSEA